MKVQRDFLNAPDKFPQGVFLLFQNAMRRICLPKRLEIMFEQPTDTPQFRDGVQIRMGGNPASEKTPPHVFRQRQSDDFRLLREARFFLGDHSERERERESRMLAAYLPPSFVPFLPLMPFAFGMRETKRQAFRESRGRQPSGRIVVVYYNYHPATKNPPRAVVKL